MKYKCIVVDDDQEAVDLIVEYISYIPILTVQATFTKPLLALENFKTLQEPIDFLFMDVEMPMMTGLELVTEINQKFKYLIIVTGFAKYWKESFRVNARKFIQKPFNFQIFESTIYDLLERCIVENPIITLNSGDTSVFTLDLNKLIFVEASDHHIIVHTHDGHYGYVYKISQLERDLKPYGMFLRISKKHIISKTAIFKTDGFTVQLKNGEKLNVGETYRGSFKQYRKSF